MSSLYLSIRIQAPRLKMGGWCELSQQQEQHNSSSTSTQTNNKLPVVLRSDVALRRPHVDAGLVHPSVSELHLESLKAQLGKTVTNVRRTKRKRRLPSPCHTIPYIAKICKLRGTAICIVDTTVKWGHAKSRDIAVQQPHIQHACLTLHTNDTPNIR